MDINYLYLKYREREWAYQVLVLVVSVIFWHAIYTGLIRPVAEATLEIQKIQSEVTNELNVSEKSVANTVGRVAIVLKDYEQEACFIAAFWALFIMLFKWGEIRNTRQLFNVAGRHGQDNFLGTQTGKVILSEPEDMQKYRAIFESIDGQSYGNNALFRTASACVNRFFTTSKIADATTAMERSCTAEAERLETGLGVVRYLVWVIPSLGFIGTVRGISDALGKAEEAVQGNIAPVTESLGTAFNSTLIALAISIVIMFLLHKLQESQETLILDIQHFCDENILRYMKES